MIVSEIAVSKGVDGAPRNQPQLGVGVDVDARVDRRADAAQLVLEVLGFHLRGGTVPAVGLTAWRRAGASVFRNRATVALIMRLRIRPIILLF